MADPKTEIPSLLEKVIGKGGDVNVCLSYLKEKAEKEESLRLKEIEREDKLKQMRLNVQKRLLLELKRLL